MNLLLDHIKSFRVLSVLALLGKKLKYIPILPILIDEQVKLFTFLFRPRVFLKMKELIDGVNKELRADTRYHRFGGIAFWCQKKEVAHIHGNGLLDIHFPEEISTLLISKGLCATHHVFPQSGWTSCYLTAKTDLHACIQLIRWSLYLKTGAGTIRSIEQDIHQYLHAGRNNLHSF